MTKEAHLLSADDRCTSYNIALVSQSPLPTTHTRYRSHSLRKGVQAVRQAACVTSVEPLGETTRPMDNSKKLSTSVVSVDWEPLGTPLRFELTDGGELVGFSIAELRRNSEFGLVGRAVGRFNREAVDALLQEHSEPEGTRVKPDTLKGVTDDRANVLVDGVIVRGRSFSPTESYADFTSTDIAIEYPPERRGRTHRWVVWILNGPKDILYPRTTTRQYTTTLKRTRQNQRKPSLLQRLLAKVREEVPGATDDVQYSTATSSVAGDYLRLSRLSQKPFAVDLSSVPSEVSPRFGSAVAIEFAGTSWHERTRPDFLDPLLQALSFGLGRRLIEVGTSAFNEKGRGIVHRLKAAHSVNLEKEQAQPSMPPIPLQGESRRPMSIEDETNLSELVSLYMDSRNLYAFDDAMALVWLSAVTPMDVGLSHLATALEMLMKSWFESSASTTGGRHIPKEDWRSIANDAKDFFSTRLGEHPGKDKILRRVDNMNSMGVNERFEQFFDELGLPYKDVERHAIRSRNKVVHGHTLDEAKAPELIPTVFAYRTILHKVVLKLAGYSGSYVDYSTYGHPVRSSIVDPLRGPDDDGNPAKF